MNESGGAAIRRFLTQGRALPKHAVVTIGSAYLASRAVVLAAAWFAENLAPNPTKGVGEGGALLRSLTGWDGSYYLSIARDGYHAEALTAAYHDYVFFPLYPLLIRLFSAPFPDAAPLLAVVISHVAFLVALGLLYLLGRPHLGSARAAGAAALLAIFPFATVFSMAYSESMFLLLMVGAFLAAERGHRATVGLCLGLACLTRSQGVLLTIPLAVLLLRQDHWKVRQSTLWLAAGPLAFLAYIGFVWSLTGNPAAYSDAQAAWGHPGISPGPPDLQGLVGIPPLAVMLFVTVAVYIFLLVYVRQDRLEPEYVTLPILFLLPLIPLGWLQSAPRYLMLAFPYAWILARRRNAIFRRAWPVVSSGLLAALSLLTFAGAFPP